MDDLQWKSLWTNGMIWGVPTPYFWFNTHMIRWPLASTMVSEHQHKILTKIWPKYGNTSWWLNQPIWKICSSNWIISPNRDENKKYLKPPPSNMVQLSLAASWGFLVFQMHTIPNQVTHTHTLLHSAPMLATGVHFKHRWCKTWRKMFPKIGGFTPNHEF